MKRWEYSELAGITEDSRVGGDLLSADDDWQSRCGGRRRIDPSVWRLFIVLLTPLLLCPLPIAVQTQEAQCAYILIIVAVYWTTESLPLGVTALIPAVLFPMFGIIRSKEVAMDYMKETIMLYLGGYVVAVSIEKWNLHKRIALKVMLTLGYTVPRLLMGFMLPSLVLSMWISNTATTTMMIPIVEAVLQQLKWHMVPAPKGETIKLRSNAEDINGIEQGESDDDSLSKYEDDDMAELRERQYRCVCKAMCLGVAYASTCGGTATLIGTGTNVLLKSQADAFFMQEYGRDSGITFANWMLFALPLAIICMMLCWLWLQIHWFGFRDTLHNLNMCNRDEDTERLKAIEMVLRKEYSKLGPLSFAEKGILVNFTLLAVLWLSRDPGFAPGWATLFADGYVGAMVPALFIAVMLFVFPSKSPRQSCKENGVWIHEPLMDLDTMMHKVPWHILLLFGGGMAIAHGCQDSGLSLWAGSQLSGLKGIPPWVLILIIATFVSFFTEFTSNTAVIAILMPVLLQMAVVIHVHPLLLVIPAGVACSYAFMLPVATPPNAIVFAYGHLTVVDMVKSGFVMNCVCVLMVTLAANTWGGPIFGYHQQPDILPPENTTLPVTVPSIDMTSAI